MLVDRAVTAEEVASTVTVSDHATFQAKRRRVREALDTAGVTKAVDAAIIEILKQ